MKKSCLKRFAAVCICVFLVLPLSVTVASANEEYISTEWKMDPNLEFIYGDNKRYDRYYVNGAFYSDPKTSFCFSNTVTFNGKERTVYGDSAYPHIVSVEKGDGYSFVFTDDDGEKILNDFLAGVNCVYYLEKNDDSYTVIDKSLVEGLDVGYETKSRPNIVHMEVSRLTEAEVFELTVHDSLEITAYQHGAIYRMPDGKVYYLSFKNLDNSHFDADGFFSYRSGTVELMRLDSVKLSEVNAALSKMQRRNKMIIYESFVMNGYYDINGEPTDDEWYDDGYSDTEIETLFWVIFISIGFILPIVAMIPGLVFPRIESLGKNKDWYIVSVLAAVWMVAALGILLLII